MNYYICLVLTFVHLSQAAYNRLIRVDGINPTCYNRTMCKEYEVSGAVINVDKSLAYMGSNFCCMRFFMHDDVARGPHEHDAYFLGRVLPSTQLDDNEYIAFFEDDLTLVRNITSADLDPYKVIYFRSPVITVEFHKERYSRSNSSVERGCRLRSRYDILLGVYYKGDSPICNDKDNYIRCGPSNKTICIDEKLACDKFPHCPEGTDEEMCAFSHETTANYDKVTVSIVMAMMIGFIALVCFLIFLLCFCKSRESVKDCFISIFGYKGKAKNLELVLDSEHLLRNMNPEKRNTMINES